MTLEDRLARIVSLRESGRDEQARLAAMELVEEHPDNAEANLQCAWSHDKLGMEREAVPFYVKAIDIGLEGDQRIDAFLGLGSTYRALGHYTDALSTLSRGVAENPDDRGLQVFHAMALYNNGRHKEACELLLRLLIDTTSDPAISGYSRALSTYAADLDRTWA